MLFQRYPFARTKQTMPNVLALNVRHLASVCGRSVSFCIANVLSFSVCTCPLGTSASVAGVKTFPLTSLPSPDEIAADMFAQDGLQRPCYQSGINDARVQRKAT